MIRIYRTVDGWFWVYEGVTDEDGPYETDVQATCAVLAYFHNLEVTNNG